MAFYIIEKQIQLERLKPFKDCFVQFIQSNDNFHPSISPLSLVYIRDLDKHKGFIFCINHNESFSLTQQDVEWWLLNNTKRLFVMNKKSSLYHFGHPQKLFDINFIENFNTNNVNIPAINYYYNKYPDNPIINQLIPISKHYEKNELLFDIVSHIIQRYQEDNVLYAFNNGPLTQAFYNIEKQGIKISKQNFIDCYGNIKYPEYNINKGRIYSQYNLYKTTGRPSNTYNNINFAALDKHNGERLCYIPSNDSFLELDIQGYHPRLIGELIDFNFPKDKNTYEVLGELLGVTQQEAKELTFKQIYGGIWEEFQNKPFFKDIENFNKYVWIAYNSTGVSTNIRNFKDINNMTKPKLLSYIIQSIETSKNVIIINNILDYLKDKKTKLILYTYDAFLLDFDEEEKDIIEKIKEIISYPVTIKQGKSYHGLKKM